MNDEPIKCRKCGQWICECRLNANLRAQLAQAQARVGDLENERFTLRQILHDIAFFSFVVDGRLHPEYENGWNAAIEKITQAAQKHFTDKGILADDFDKLDEQLAQRDAEIAELRKDRERLDDDTESLLSKYGLVSICRLPDWNYAVYRDDICCGIGMTVSEAMAVAKSNIEKIDAAIAAAELKGTPNVR